MTDDQVSEFISIVQKTLRQADFPLDYGAREVYDRSANLCKIYTSVRNGHSRIFRELFLVWHGTGYTHSLSEMLSMSTSEMLEPVKCTY